MFGYVKAFPPELTLREYELYRAGYCGVCRAMGRCNGRTSCAGLTWDSVFLFFVRTALTKDPFEVKRIFCLLHPFRKRQAVLSTPQIDYAARASAVLIHGKLQDDKKDERGVKKLRASLLLPLASRHKKRAALPELEERCGAILAKLAETERERPASFDLPASLSGELTAEVFSCGLPAGSEEERLAREIGFHTGKFVYAADAADDFLSDQKAGRYNPYAALFGRDTLTEDDKEGIFDGIRYELTAIERALALIDFSGITGIEHILSNIVGEGMLRTAQTILTDEKRSGKTEE